MTEDIREDLEGIVDDMEMHRGAWFSVSDETGVYDISRETSLYILGVLKAIIARGGNNGN